MANNKEGLKTIWYFVGIVLTLMGALVMLAAAIDLFSSVPPKTVLANLHPGLWWGGLMLLTGIIYLSKNRGKVVK
jgi:hypothetical protein